MANLYSENIPVLAVLRTEMEDLILSTPASLYVARKYYHDKKNFRSDNAFFLLPTLLKNDQKLLVKVSYHPAKFAKILLGDKNVTYICSKIISTLPKIVLTFHCFNKLI